MSFCSQECYVSMLAACALSTVAIVGAGLLWMDRSRVRGRLVWRLMASDLFAALFHGTGATIVLANGLREQDFDDEYDDQMDDRNIKKHCLSSGSPFAELRAWQMIFSDSSCAAFFTVMQLAFLFYIFSSLSTVCIAYHMRVIMGQATTLSRSMAECEAEEQPYEPLYTYIIVGGGFIVWMVEFLLSTTSVQVTFISIGSGATVLNLLCIGFLFYMLWNATKEASVMSYAAYVSTANASIRRLWRFIIAYIVCWVPLVVLALAWGINNIVERRDGTNHEHFEKVVSLLVVPAVALANLQGFINALNYRGFSMSHGGTLQQPLLADHYGSSLGMRIPVLLAMNSVASAPIVIIDALSDNQSERENTELPRLSSPGCSATSAIGLNYTQSPESSLNLKVTFDAEPFACGGFATVHQGTFKGRSVAVKILPFHENAELEIKMWARADSVSGALAGTNPLHPIVPRFFGVVFLSKLPELPTFVRHPQGWNTTDKHAQIVGIVSELCTCALSDVVLPPVDVLASGEASGMQGSMSDRSSGLRDSLPPYTPALMRRLAIDLLSAVHFLHEQLDMVHHDLTPQNVLVTTDGRVRLCDFGMAYHFRPDYVSQPSFDGVGTPAYLPPEVWGLEAGGQSDVGSTSTTGLASPDPEQPDFDSVAWDVYSLGMLLYFMAERSHPFQNPTDLLFTDPSMHSHTLASDAASAYRSVSATSTLSWKLVEALGETPRSRATSGTTQLDSHQVIDAVVGGARPKISSSCPPVLATLIADMWQENPSERPTIPDAISALQHDPEVLAWDRWGDNVRR
uniref:Protein kinase domain-containing protein n=1 Tax=Rhizochromulina marina TaxID=1034831 RepID=A0A7S2RCQ2_9STRA|mmetsp:Transcript_14328/g.42282  ORF Transcript_14328/g.42282 Transcript_14328/m.42282 type:complete len:799 (+) Transcript_14328:29-2425(+)